MYQCIYNRGVACCGGGGERHSSSLVFLRGKGCTCSQRVTSNGGYSADFGRSQAALDYYSSVLLYYSKIVTDITMAGSPLRICSRGKMHQDGT